MYELKKKLARYLRVNLLGPGPRLMKKEFSGPRYHEGWETLLWTLTARNWREPRKYQYNFFLPEFDPRISDMLQTSRR